MGYYWNTLNSAYGLNSVDINEDAIELSSQILPKHTKNIRNNRALSGLSHVGAKSSYMLNQRP